MKFRSKKDRVRAKSCTLRELKGTSFYKTILAINLYCCI